MNFDFSDDQKLLKDHLGKFLSAECTPKDVRKVLEGEETYAKSVWQGLADMGLMSTAIPEKFGGTGAGYLELCVVAEELGRALAPVPFSSSIYLFAEALLSLGSEAQKQERLPAIATGRSIGCLAVTEIAGQDMYTSMSTCATAGKLTGSKLAVSDAGITDIALVAARSAQSDDMSLYLVDLNDDSVTRNSLESIDPTRNVAGISFRDTPAELLGEPGEGWRHLDALYNRAAVLQSFEQLGGALRSLEMAVEYAKERYAFGRPIGSFQGLKHLIADMYVAAELARSNCYYGAWALSTNAPELPLAAATARVSATKAFQLCSKDNIQVHGGMGFTWEVDCHLFYRRSNFLALELGSLSTWENRLVDQLQLEHVA